MRRIVPLNAALGYTVDILPCNKMESKAQERVQRLSAQFTGAAGGMSIYRFMYCHAYCEPSTRVRELVRSEWLLIQSVSGCVVGL